MIGGLISGTVMRWAAYCPAHSWVTGERMLNSVTALCVSDVTGYEYLHYSEP